MFINFFHFFPGDTSLIKGPGAKFIWFGFKQVTFIPGGTSIPESRMDSLWCSPPFPWILKLFHVWFKSLWFKPPWSLRKTKFNVRIINYLANRFFAYLLTWSYQSKLEWPSNCWFFGCQFFFIVPLIIYFWFNMLCYNLIVCIRLFASLIGTLSVLL